MHENATIEGVEGEVLEQVVEPEQVGEAPQQATGEEVVDESKKFQSMYDRKSADYEKLNSEVEELRKYQQLGKVIKKNQRLQKILLTLGKLITSPVLPLMR